MAGRLLLVSGGQKEREQLARQAMEAYEQALQLHPYFSEAMLHLAR
jgi:cytochrome c-type biogenesis protein CcmH/NrfG